MKTKVLELWNKVPDAWKVRIISISTTFFSMFVSTVAAGILAVGTIEWSTAFWVGLITAGVREGFKAVVSTFVPVRLGGRK